MKKCPIRTILNWFGKDLNSNYKKSLIFNHMMEVTHGSWLEDLQRKNQIDKYKYELYTLPNNNDNN